MDQQKGFFSNIAFNLIIPVVILNNGSKDLGDNGPLLALLLALSFPLGYGLWDYYKLKKTNALSILGIANVVVTGGLALADLEGIWFAVKEAAFPLIIGIAIALSSRSEKPFLEDFITASGILQWEMVKERLLENDKMKEWAHIIKRATLFLAGSFLVSAIVNFVLAIFIFKEIDPSLSGDQRSEVLNKQIAEMTWMGFLVLMIPSMIMTGAILWYVLKNLSAMTSLSTDEILGQPVQEPVQKP